MIEHINLNGTIYQYELQRKNVKNINIRVKPDCSIFVSANDSVSLQTINNLLISKSDFITRSIEHYKELKRYAPKPKQYVDGESFKICGHERRLKVFSDNKNYVKTDEAYIILCVTDTDDYNLKKKTMDKWIEKQCKDIVTSVCNAVYPKFQKYNIEFPQLKFRKMVTRWGSCQSKRKILTFNIALVEAPIACIEYVVVHEFTHFLQPNHSKKFYTQLSMFMPNWIERKKTLEQNNGYF